MVTHRTTYLCPCRSPIGIHLGEASVVSVRHTVTAQSSSLNSSTYVGAAVRPASLGQKCVEFRCFNTALFLAPVEYDKILRQQLRIICFEMRCTHFEAWEQTSVWRLGFTTSGPKRCAPMNWDENRSCWVLMAGKEPPSAYPQLSDIFHVARILKSHTWV